MKTFKIEIIETLSKIVEVEAETVEEALQISYRKYLDAEDEFVLDSGDLTGQEIKPYKE